MPSDWTYSCLEFQKEGKRSKMMAYFLSLLKQYFLTYQYKMNKKLSEQEASHSKHHQDKTQTSKHKEIE